jgi:non-specific serine/threonine protein kinase
MSDIMSRLTNREKEVGTLLAQGKRQKQIAEVLVISPHTVRDHVRRIRSKIGASSMFEAAVMIAQAEKPK